MSRFRNGKRYGELIDELKNRVEQIQNPDNLHDFMNFPLTEETKKGLESCDYKTASYVQRRGIMAALQGHDVLCAAKTGSGKTLAFIVPLLEKLYIGRWSKSDGLGALVISPTRELAFQIFETLTRVGKYHNFSAGVIFGGKSLAEEAQCISVTNIVICTPGRLLQHMDETYGFDASSVLMLVLDEADRILDLGFSKTMQAIMENLNLPNNQRQTLLYSATQTSMVSTLVRLSLKNPIFIEGELDYSIKTPVKLRQVYTILSEQQKLSFIWTFLRTHESKILIFLHTCKQVMYYSNLFRQLRISVPIMGLCGRMGQTRRIKVYEKFKEMDVVALFATDIAARGLDFPNVDWVIQLDCPSDAETYIHRVGRTARYGSNGKAALILTHSQTPFIDYLTAMNIPIKESKLSPDQVIDVSQRVQTTVDADAELKGRAKRALRTYIKAIGHCSDKKIFDVSSIDIWSLSKSFGIEAPSMVKINGQIHGVNKRRKDEGTEDSACEVKLMKSENSSSNDEESKKGNQSWFKITQFDDL